MKFRTESRWKARSRKRKGCWANKKQNENECYKKKKIDTSNEPSPESSNVNTETSKTVKKSNNVNTVFNPVTNKSAEKINRNSFFNKSNYQVGSQKSERRSARISNVKEQLQPVTGNSIINVQNIQSLLSSASVCLLCKIGKLELYEEKCKRKGLSQTFFTRCKNCNHTVNMNTSTKKGNSPYDINLKSAHAACQGMGFAGLKRICISFDLPAPVTKKPFNNLCKTLANTSFEKASVSMKNAANTLFTLVENEKPENIITLSNGKSVAKVAVSVDGTWQKRGHTSRIGIVFIISIMTGEVLDFVIKSLVCHMCNARKHWDKTGSKYIGWWEQHKSKCTINHSGSSDKMETDGAIEMFTRSVEKNNLQYTTFIGDGDSNCFASVKKALENAPEHLSYNVEKEECVGHIQKRMGTALRNFKKKAKGTKLSDGKGVSGQGRLTDDLINKIQNYYGQCIRNNKGDLNGMHNDIWAIFKHIVIDNNKSLEEQHANCPKDRWCKFWNDRDNYSESSRLPSAFIPVLEPIFKRLSDKDILSRCLKGFTQNQNEALNGTVWNRCPKTRFCGQRRVQIAVCEAICVFNSGAGAVFDLLSSVSMKPTNATKALHDENKRRLFEAARKISLKARLIRRKKRAEKKSKGQDKNITYLAGSFGINSTPDVIDMKVKPKHTSVKKMIVKPIFVADEDVRGFILDCF